LQKLERTLCLPAQAVTRLPSRTICTAAIVGHYSNRQWTYTHLESLSLSSEL